MAIPGLKVGVVERAGGLRAGGGGGGKVAGYFLLRDLKEGRAGGAVLIPRHPHR